MHAVVAAKRLHTPIIILASSYLTADGAAAPHSGMHLAAHLAVQRFHVSNSDLTAICPCPCHLHRFSLDTGRLNAETYQLFDAVEKHYNIHIEYTFPDAQV